MSHIEIITKERMNCMYTYLLVTKGSMGKIQSLMERAKKAKAKIESILSYSGEGVLTDCAIQSLENERKQIEAYILGAMKANYDCLPRSMQRKQKVNETRLEQYIKISVQVMLRSALTKDTDIAQNNLVLEFARGYSETFRQIAAQAGIIIEETTVNQDITKNQMYFTNKLAFTYRLDGKFGKTRINKGVYYRLKKRSKDSFEEMLFAF